MNAPDYRIRTLVVLLILLLAATVACGPAAEEPPVTEPAPAAEAAPTPEPPIEPEITVAVVNEPLRAFAEAIGGSRVEVLFPVPEGVDPAFWSPEAETVVEYQNADLVLLSGADFAPWVDRVSLRRDRVVDTSQGYADRLIAVENAVTHSHGAGGEHSHHGFASITWLDFDLAREQAAAITEALAERLPAHAEEIRARGEELQQRLEALDLRAEAAIAGLGGIGTPVLFSHPTYQYLERRYGLNGEAVDWEPGEAPTAEQWQELDRLLSEHPTTWMIWEGTPTPETVAELERRGVEVVVVEPATGPDPERGFLARMEANVEALEAAGAAAE